MIIGKKPTSPSGNVLRDTEFGDLPWLDQITNRCDWPLQNVGRHASCSEDDMQLLKTLTRQDAARPGHHKYHYFPVYKPAKIRLIQCLSSEPLGSVQKPNGCRVHGSVRSGHLRYSRMNHQWSSPRKLEAVDGICAAKMSPGACRELLLLSSSVMPDWTAASRDLLISSPNGGHISMFIR